MPRCPATFFAVLLLGFCQPACCADKYRFWRVGFLSASSKSIGYISSRVEGDPAGPMITFRDSSGAIATPCGSGPVSTSGDHCSCIGLSGSQRGPSPTACSTRSQSNPAYLVQVNWPDNVGCSSNCVSGPCSAKTCNSGTGLRGLFDGQAFQGGSRIPENLFQINPASNPNSIAVSDQWYQYDFGVGNEKDVIEYDLKGQLSYSIIK